MLAVSVVSYKCPLMYKHNAVDKTLWPSGLRRWLKAPVRKGVGSNPTGVMACGMDLQNMLYVLCAVSVMCVWL